MRYVRARDRGVGEHLIAQAHWTASLAMQGWAGQLKPLAEYLPGAKRGSDIEELL